MASFKVTGSIVDASGYSKVTVALLVANGTISDNDLCHIEFSATGTGGIANRTVDTMTGDNSDTTLSLSQSPGSENNVTVTFDGVTQHHDTYSLSGSTITFSTAPPTGVKVEAVSGGLESIGTPSDGTVTTAKIADVNVTTGKIADNAITLAKMAGGTDGQIITYDASGDPVAVGPGSDGQVLTSTGAGSPPAFEAVPAGGDKRNYFIDGAHTQWPEGTAATAFSDDYQAGGHPLFVHYNITGTGTLTTERSTDVPTIAASGYQSKYSQLIKCTGTDAVPATSTQVSMRYHMTGTDFAHLHQQEITVSFWAKTSAQNAGHKYFWTLINSANNRTYSHSFSPTATWTKFSHTLTLDTSGTWLFTEADVGMKFQINLAIGPEYDDATEDTWTAGFELHDGTISNFTDHTSNEFYFTQIQIVKGSSSPDFTSPPIATVQDQVQYYVEAFNFDQEGTAQIHLGTGVYVSTTQLRTHIPFNTRKRATPTMTNSSTADDFSIQYGASGCNVVTINGWIHANTVSAVYMTTQTPTVTGGEAGQARIRVSGAWILADARH